MTKNTASGKTCQGQTLQLITNIHKLPTKTFDNIDHLDVLLVVTAYPAFPGNLIGIYC